MHTSTEQALLCLAALALGAVVMLVVPAPSALPEALASGLEQTIAEQIMSEEMPDEMAFAETADFHALPRDLETLVNPTGWLIASFERCGTISLDRFEGRWRPALDAPEWNATVVEAGRLEAGTMLRSEHCLVHVVERSSDRVLGVAVFHEDVADPGDAWLTYIQLSRRGEAMEVCVSGDLDRLSSPQSCAELTRAEEP